MQRDKALEMALGQIEKQYGKGAVMRMDEQAKVKIACIPTGALSLDLALGIGGLPRGRVVEVYGPEGSGKCLVADTHVWTDRGLETIAELFERCGQKASCTSRVTDVRHLGVRAVNEHGELEQIAALTHNNRHPVLRVRLKSGRTLSVTHNHPLRVVNDQGYIVWRKAGQIAEGDTVVSATFGAVEAAEGDGLTEDEAALVGYLVAEGSLSSRHAVRFTNWDHEVGDDFTRLMGGLFDVEVRCYDRKEYAAHSKAIRSELAERYGLDYVNAGGKTVPGCIRTGGAKIQRAFLSALFEGDGWIDTSSTVGIGSASEQLAREVQLMLYGFGIPATVSSSFNTTYERYYWTVTVNPASAHRFLDEIGFRSARRQAQVAANFRRSTLDPQFENIPHVGKLVRTLRDDLGGDRAFDRIARDLFRSDMDLHCSRRRIAKIVAWAEQRALSGASAAIVDYLRHLAEARYTYEQVTAIEDGGLQPTFDIVLPGTHSFVANGVLSHNTTVALHAIAEAQKAGGIAAFIDAEHALDPSYASALGVDIEALLVSQPDNGEQALEIADMLIRSNAIDILVVDSVAALTPRAEIEGEMGDSHVGLQARLMSQALRKLAGTLNRSRTCAVFVNQIREKIGVLFGCFEANTMVTLGDGTQEKIGTIVDQRMDVEVLSYDHDLGRIVPKRVINWFDNGPAEDFLRIRVARSGPSGRGSSRFTCTPNHQIRTPGGWREAQELAVDDRVLQAVPHYLSEFQWEVLLGGLMGDGALSPNQNGHAARYRWGHGSKQAGYGDWKASLFANVGVSRSTNAKGAVFHDTQPLPELAELRDAVYIGGKKVLSDDYLKRLTPLSLAIWYMDDGGFTLRTTGKQERTQGGSGRVEICVAAFEPSSRLRLADHLRDTWGINATLIMKGQRKVPALLFSKSETAKLHALIAPYVHPSMEYKLLPGYRGQFQVAPVFADKRYELTAMPITSIERKPRPQPERTTRRYDLEVEGTHNYFVDGVMVHNSPETQPGGRALKFYSSVRLDVRRIESLKDGTDFVGNRVRVKVVKNKCVAAGTRVVDPTTGTTHAIEDIVDRGKASAVWAADKRGELHVRPIAARMDQGQQEVIGLELGDGRTLWVTPDHLIRTEAGWRQAGSLTPGDRVARPLPVGGTHRDPWAPRNLLAAPHTEPALDHLRRHGVTPARAARLLGLADHEAEDGWSAVLGAPRLRRGRVEQLARALDSAFLRETLAEELYYDPVVAVAPARWERTFDLEVDELHNFVADDVVVHNCAPPFRQAEFDIMFGSGISKEGSVLDVGVEHGIVKKAGAWYTYDGEQLGQGRENARSFLKEHDEVCAEIYKKVTEALGLVPTDVTGTDGDLDEVPPGPADQ